MAMSMPSSSSDIPPGLRPGLIPYTAGSHSDADWLAFDEKKNYTNAFIIQDGKVPLTTFVIARGEAQYPSPTNRFYSDIRREGLEKTSWFGDDFILYQTLLTSSLRNRFNGFGEPLSIPIKHSIRFLTSAGFAQGGKVEPGETPLEAAKRELQVEAFHIPSVP
jgi:hypothetical protein